MDFEEIINEIMSLDPKIRYVGIIFDNMRLAKMRPGVANLLTPEETQESLNDSMSRWMTRKKLSNKLGEAIYALAEYRKVIRITIPIKQDGLILVSMEPDGFHEIIVKEVLEIVKDRF